MNTKYGIVKYLNKYYMTVAKYDNEYYATVNSLIKDCSNIKRKLKQFYIPENINIDIEKDLCIEYKRAIKEANQQQIDENKIIKNRYYLKIVDPDKSKQYISNTLTFVLFNPSYASHFKLDPSIQNCAYLAFEKYANKCITEIEIFNLFALRNSNNILQDFSEIDFNLQYLLEQLSDRDPSKIVLGWGFGKSKQYPNRISEVLNHLDTTKLKQIAQQNNPNIMLHPDNRYWNLILKSPFRQNAIITEYKY